MKGFTARQANLILNRTGEPFWQAESYDHWVRNEPEYFRIAASIENNPVKAGLVGGLFVVECDVNERGVHAKKRLDTSDGRSLGERLWRQRGFLESVEAADTSGSPPFGRSLASLTQHPKWAGEIAINCFQIRSLARSSQRVVSGKCLRHESDPKQLLKGNAYRRTPWAKPLLRANAAA